MKPLSPENRKRLLLGAALLVLLPLVSGGVFFLYRNDPETARWMPFCVFHRATGLYCPGCGAARSLHRLLHGDFIGALRANWLLWPMLAVAAGLLVSRRLNQCRWLGQALLLILILYWILRNLPFAPFCFLAPQ